MNRKLILVVAIILVSSLSLFAQVSNLDGGGSDGVNLKQTGQTSMNFLLIPVSARASGMGNSFTALSKGIESVFYNPAGLTEMDTKTEFFFSSTKWFADINYLAGAVAYNADNYGSFALSFVYVDYGTIQGASLIPNSQAGSDPLGYTLTGDIKNVGAYSFGLSYVKKISDKFSMGGTMKYVGQQLGQSTGIDGNTSNNNENKLAFDLGVKFFPGIESLRLGMSMRNFSTFVKYHSFSSPLPIMFAVGLGMNVMDVINKDIANEHSLMVSGEFLHPNNYTDRMNFGLEYTFKDIFSLRTGYQTNNDILSWSGGLGVKQSLGGVIFNVDYSYSKTKIFNGINRFSIRIAY